MGTPSNTPANAADGQNPSQGQSQAQDEASTTLGVGGATSGQAGATPMHESQAETGGSGGAQLTHSHGEIQAPPDGAQAAAPGGSDARPNARPDAGPDAGPSADAVDSAMQTGARGAQDTRAGQGGGTGTGLGSRESGANQSAQDLPPR